MNHSKKKIGLKDCKTLRVISSKFKIKLDKSKCKTKAKLISKCRMSN